MIKRYLFTGLLILLPPAITLLVLLFIMNFFLRPFLGVTTAILSQYEVFTRPYPLLTGEETLAITSRLFLLLIFFLTMLFVGFLGRLFLLRFFGNIFEYFILQIPVMNRIYLVVQEMVKNLYEQRLSRYSHVVLVPFPHPKIMSLGFVTQSQLPTGSATDPNQISVFVSCAPTPIFGLSLLFRKEDVIPLKITVGEATKLIVSCGIIQPQSFLKNSKYVYSKK